MLYLFNYLRPAPGIMCYNALSVLGYEEHTLHQAVVRRFKMPLQAIHGLAYLPDGELEKTI